LKRSSQSGAHGYGSEWDVFRQGVPLTNGTGRTATLFNEINKVERSPECRQGLFFDQYSQKSIHDAQSCLRDCRWSAFFQDGHR
jgi:hypothetical protein